MAYFEQAGLCRKVRVVGDVHGEADPFRCTVQEAVAEDRYIIQLGDLINHGPDSVTCLRIAMSLVESGRGVFLRGNHEAEFLNYIQASTPPPNYKLTSMLRQIETDPKGRETALAFVKMWDCVPWWLHSGQFLFVHGAFHPAMLGVTHPDAVEDRELREQIRFLALWGEGTPPTGEGLLPPRTYRWVNQIPNDFTVVVGHDVRSKLSPLAVDSARGGRAIFVDTGCGKGGKLSWLDLEVRS